MSHFFVIPKAVVKQIEKLCRTFQGNADRRRALVGWARVSTEISAGRIFWLGNTVWSIGKLKEKM